MNLRITALAFMLVHMATNVGGLAQTTILLKETPLASLSDTTLTKLGERAPEN